MELQLNIGAITVDIEAPLVQVNVLLLFTQKGLFQASFDLACNMANL